MQSNCEMSSKYFNKFLTYAYFLDELLHLGFTARDPALHTQLLAMLFQFLVYSYNIFVAAIKTGIILNSRWSIVFIQSFKLIIKNILIKKAHTINYDHFHASNYLIVNTLHMAF